MATFPGKQKHWDTQTDTQNNPLGLFGVNPHLKTHPKFNLLNLI